MRNKIGCMLLFMAFLFANCSPAKQTTNTVAQKPESTVLYPSQPISTPADINFVYDYENIYMPQDEKKLDTLLRNFERSNLISIKLTTVNDPSVNADNFDANNAAILKEWAATHGKSEKCMSISISKNLRKMRIDFGSFVANLLSDTETSEIIENQFKPYFKEEKYYEGTYNGLNALMDTIRKNIRF